ncbi:MAG: hypothetical protein A3J30_03555 [Candidatus Wildermuthbacteria bacterium RIFCSPLOWO2_02_FULL_47_9c]|uniref:Imidazoleglycerol-phosphate dehydratase n=2 Tax=Parcubacteria group TaxID=1794811 RepID=A0A837ILX2_9BACT|nr:MAG: Imidazoleglycerol-phosphate dehydratase [Candidatus Yanofskybacteria bacterium GW2011_GWC1_48_11]KKW03968.1 MAG: Imidazoleglycerol-phosphate dehydratase [Parcubacteria group bacterium GW2011_GWB1_49_12]KKW08686.1 MAG: Imidazoleglycerol-phosphate dehydratase [Parcubacteria group bacterium GW2011_GWA1_49_26]KKW13903.1 MAG: Imidazoleglycerol-phosphate dehydratase [Parcubacteria group bacterium GW2011_GWA2_50_10]OHA61636.1 MAG: hypothetical protein A2109_02730 [Candidatus Wildermuthbacteria
MEEKRFASVERETNETKIAVTVNLDGQGNFSGSTGNGFSDHLLAQLARHGMFDITVGIPRGDIHISWHHVTEDTAIVLGRAFLQARGEGRGIRRMGDKHAPLDETLARVVVDCSGRPYAVVDTSIDPDVMLEGVLPGDLVRHFLETFATEARITLHAKVLYGKNPHHKAEAVFKALARALREAHEPDSHAAGQVPSTKGTLS